MANYTFTPSAVIGGGGAQQYTAGEAIDAGLAVYKHTDNKVYKADNTTAAKADVIGVTLCTAEAANQPVMVQSSGSLTVSSAFSGAGKILAVASAPGKFMDIADLTTQFATIGGISTAATTLNLSLQKFGIEAS